MPFGDRRGPEGTGPKTGRGLGKCAGHEEALGVMQRGRGRARRGRGSRGGRGARGRRGRSRERGFWYPDEPLTEEEKKARIEHQIKVREEEIALLKKELETEE